MAQPPQLAPVERRLRRRLWLRVTLPIVAVAILWLGIGGYAAWCVYHLHARATEILNVNVANIRAADEVILQSQRIRYLLRQGAQTFNSRHAARAAELLGELSGSTRRLAQSANSREDRQLGYSVERGRLECVAALAAIDHGGMYSTVAERLEDISERLLPAKVINPSGDYIARNETQIRLDSAQVERASRQLIVGLLLLGLTGGAAGIVTGYGAARIIGRRLLELSIPLRDVAGQLDQVAGPLMFSVDPRENDLEEVLQRIAERVGGVVEQLQQSQYAAVRSEQLAALGQLAAGLSHELRNPLMAIVAILGDPDTRVELNQRDITILREEATRLDSLVQSLLDFARPNPPRPTPINLRDLIKSVVDVLRARATHRGVDLMTGPVPMEAVAIADVGHLRQIVLNLLLNAVDATPKDGLVTVGVRREASSFAVTIEDEGTGLPEHLGDRIFEPFVSGKETGIGLGLSISRRLAELNGGTLKAISTDGGAVFTVRVPAPTASLTKRRHVAEARG